MKLSCVASLGPGLSTNLWDRVCPDDNGGSPMARKREESEATGGDDDDGCGREEVNV